MTADPSGRLPVAEPSDVRRAAVRLLRADRGAFIAVLALNALAAAAGLAGPWLVGRIVEMYDDEGLADIDRLSIHYGGQAYPNRESPRVSAWMAVERSHGWGAAS